MHIIAKSLSAGALALLAQPSFAGVFLDYSPTDVNDNGNELVNQAEDKLFNLGGGRTSLEPQQNILTQFTITSAMTLNGIDIFSRSYGNPNIPANLARPRGTGVTIKIRADAGGRPADTNVFRLLSTITDSAPVFPLITATHMRLHADFTDTMLAPGTYWIGMSGTNISVNWTYFFNTSRPDQTYNLFGERVNYSIGLNNAVALRLHGFETIFTPPPGGGGGTVPEPASWAMLITGFALTGAAARRRRRTVSA